MLDYVNTKTTDKEIEVRKTNATIQIARLFEHYMRMKWGDSQINRVLKRDTK